MKLQFKEQDFQIQAVKAVVDCFQGQPLKTNRFTLERSRELIRKAKQAASGAIQTSVFEHEVLEDIGYRNSSIQLVDRDRKSTRLNSSHVKISYAVFCLKKKKKMKDHL